MALARAHQEGGGDVALLATSASENLRGGLFPGSYEQFDRRVEAAGLAHLPVLNTPAVLGLTFWGRSYSVDTERYGWLRERIWTILFPSLERKIDLGPNDEMSDQRLRSTQLRKWRNAWCDVHNLITHIDHHRDVFVTANTKDFQRHSIALRELGVSEIMTPPEALQLIL